MDHAKIETIEKISPLTNVKGMRSFLGHVGFYRQLSGTFQKFPNFFVILLMKGAPFDFSNECLKAFETLKEKLTTASIIIASNWSLSVEIMCDASDFALGAVLDKGGTTFFK